MGTITIINLKGLSFPQHAGVYVGRANQTYGLKKSPFANPFRLERDTPEDRATVYTEYKDWLWKQIKKHRDNGLHDITFELNKLAAAARDNDIRLSCWCTPKLCHARAVALAIRYVQRQRHWPVSEILVAGAEQSQPEQVGLFE